MFTTQPRTRSIPVKLAKQKRKVANSQRVLQNAKKDHTAFICLTCEGRGYSTKINGANTYICSHGCKLGHRLFNTNQLANHIKRGDRLTCLLCQNREKEISQKLHARGAWRCTCGSQLSHQPKCPLFPTHAHEKRWPGKNKNVSEADWEFWQTAQKQRKA